jgi:hypothetical protein
VTIPILFTARNGVILFMMRPISDWKLPELKREIRDAGLAARVGTNAFAVWLAAEEQLRDAVFAACNQRRLLA